MIAGHDCSTICRMAGAKPSTPTFGFKTCVLDDLRVLLFYLMFLG